MLIAITRPVSPSINRCELTFHNKELIDVSKAAAQHAAYEACLRQLGVRVVSLAVETDLPDAVFVEDAAVVVDEAAVIPVMGAPSRRPETDGIASALAEYRPLKFLESPATLDGGDVGRNSILVNREWVDVKQFAGFELIDVPAEEPAASNALLIETAIEGVREDVVIVPSAFPRTIATLEARGFIVKAIDVSEFQKAEGGVTCKSIIFNAAEPDS